MQEVRIIEQLSWLKMSSFSWLHFISLCICTPFIFSPTEVGEWILLTSWWLNLKQRIRSFPVKRWLKKGLFTQFFQPPTKSQSRICVHIAGKFATFSPSMYAYIPIAFICIGNKTSSALLPSICPPFWIHLYLFRVAWLCSTLLHLMNFPSLLHRVRRQFMVLLPRAGRSAQHRA